MVRGVNGYIDAIVKSLGMYLNTWDEICLDEDARLRMSCIVLYAAIAPTCYALVFFNRDVIGRFVFASCLALGTCSLLFAVLQLRRRQYCLAFSLFFFFYATVMSVGFIMTSSEKDFSVLWLVIFPYIAYQIFGEGMALLFSILLLLVTLLLLFTPVVDGRFFNVAYQAGFKNNFVAIIFFTALSALLSHLFRKKTRQRLLAITNELKRYAYEDFLTGVGNRYDYERFLRDREADPGDACACYAIVDIDHFKRVNDTWGHSVGDEVLKKVSAVLRNSIRKGDQIFRWGGEEFLLILNNMPADRFEKYLNRIRNSIEQAEYSMDDGTRVRVTVSIGGSYGCQCGDDEGEGYIRRADACLYEAKERGRNRVVVSEMPPGIRTCNADLAEY